MGGEGLQPLGRSLSSILIWCASLPLFIYTSPFISIYPYMYVSVYVCMSFTARFPSSLSLSLYFCVFLRSHLSDPFSLSPFYQICTTHTMHSRLFFNKHTNAPGSALMLSICPPPSASLLVDRATCVCVRGCECNL